MELGGCSEQLIKCFTSMYDVSSSNCIVVYTRQLPDMVFEFFNFENLCMSCLFMETCNNNSECNNLLKIGAS